MRFVLADDASTDQRIPEVLSDLAALDERVTVVRRSRNLGFVGNCNRAMDDSDRDVVLLNTDTVVPPGWLDRLYTLAGESERIGSVTPVSNNAEIASVPGWLGDNMYPGAFSVEELDTLVAEVGTGDWIEIPTAVGFCVYLRRQALDVVGLFDEEAFGRGYGEENDLSLRMRDAGFLNLLCDRVFVSHIGEVSFGRAGRRKSKEDSVPLDRLWPDYQATIDRFIKLNPLRGVQARVGLGLMECSGDTQRGRTLYLLHHPITKGIIGGVEHHVADLVDGLDDESIVVSRWNGATRLEWFWEDGMTTFPLDLPGETTEWVDRALSMGIGVVHIHHTFGFAPEDTAYLLDRAADLGVPVVWSLHDYHALTPHSILDSEGEDCPALDDDGLCMSCEQRLAPTGWTVWSRRREYLRQLRRADVLIAPSESAADNYSRHDPDLEIEIRPHGIPAFEPSLREREEGLTRIGVIGKGGVHKGDEVLGALMDELSDSSIGWHLLGRDSAPAVSDDVTVEAHGLYPREDVYRVIEEAAIDAVLIYSQVDETFSLVLSEAWMMGLPVFGSERGAVGERIRRHGGGVVVPHDDVKMAARMIREVVDDPTLMRRYAEEARRAAGELVTKEQMITGYSRLYAELESGTVLASSVLQTPVPTVEERAGWLGGFASPFSADSYLDEELPTAAGFSDSGAVGAR
ncbi:MAG: glycosyltransferase [Acidimicrobiia bacterium]|nr:glycosyltransferase [Acidimicrobiia bacterium]